jgi:hypothetical protein
MASVSNPRLFGEGALMGFVGGAVASILWLASSEFLDVPTVVEIPNVGREALSWVNFVTVGVIAGLGAALVALLVDGRKGARRLFTGIALVVLGLSFFPLLTQPDDVALQTRVVLGLAHVIVYFAVVPRLAPRLRAR